LDQAPASPRIVAIRVSHPYSAIEYQIAERKRGVEQ
jgi:hypothetical protein